MAFYTRSRRAADEELLQHYLRLPGKVMFRHFVRETFNPRAANGVSHKQYSHSRLRSINGRPHVMHHGKLEPVTANVYTLENGKTFVANLRLDSEYLPEFIG